MIQNRIVNKEHNTNIRTQSCTTCFVCNSDGYLLYQKLKDRLFGASGEWNLKKCRDQNCGLLWLDPMPVEEDISKAYHRYYTHQDTETARNTWLHCMYRAVGKAYVTSRYGYENESAPFLSRLLGLLPYLHPGRRMDFDMSVMCLPASIRGHLLEIGCGSGLLMQRMRKLGWMVEGVDLDPKAVQQAKTKGLSVFAGEIEARKYRDNSFDAIVMSHVIEHVPNPLVLIQECHRILRPEGRLIVVTPNAESWGHRLYGSDWRGLEPPRHLRIFTTASLADVFTRVKFSSVKSRSIPRARDIFLASRSLQRAGEFDMSKRPATILRRWADLMEIAEWLRLKLDPKAGEELLLVAVK